MKSIKTNLIMNILKLAMTVAFPLVTFPYASRVLSPEGMGKVSFYQASISYFMLFAMLGIPTYGIKACAKYRSDRHELTKVVKEIFTINVIMTTVVYIVLLICFFSIKRFQQEPFLLLVCSFSIILNSCGIDWLFQAFEEYGYITARSFAFKLLGLVLLVLYVHDSNDYVMYAFITVISSYGSNVLNLFYARHFLDDWKSITSLDLGKHLKPILVLFSITAAASIYLNLDTVMLGIMKNDIEVGYYSTAIKIKTLTLNFVTALGTVLLPRMAYYSNNGFEKEFIQVVNKALDYVKVVSFPIVIFFILTARECILVLAGEAYLPATLAMRFIMPTVILSGFSNLIGMQIFVSKDKEIYLMKASFCGALSDLILNIILIPSWGAAGAALATTITEAVVLGIEVKYMMTIVDCKKININWMNVVIGCALGAIVVTEIKLIVYLPVFIKLTVLGISFFGVYGIILLVLKEKLVSETLHSFL